MRRPQKMTLPREVIDDIEHIRDDWQAPHLLKTYIGCLLRAGWRQKTIAQVLGISGERVRQIGITSEDSESSLEEYRVITGMQLLVPPAPTVQEENKGPRGRRRQPARRETIERLRALKPAATRYRGTDKNKEEAHLFMALVWYAHVSEGASINAIADDLGLGHGALSTRLVRYGYRSTNGTSKNYRPVGRRNTDPGNGQPH